MKIRDAFFLLAALAWSAPASAAMANLTVQTQHLDRKTANYEITIMYPRTGVAAVDDQVAQWVKAQAANFAQSAADKQPGETAWTLDISYTVTRNDSEMFETLFEYDTYTGGAHPNMEYHTLNFMLPDGTRVYLPEIVGTAGIAKVSEIAIKNLIDQIATGAEPVSDADTIRMGAGPHADNFAAFTVTKDSLRLYFAPYAVASYAAGPQTTEIPLSKLRGVMRRDWRAPQPSFECANALTPIEKAICADVQLARLDRQVAETYSWKLRLAENDAERTQIRDQQRAFIANRDATCATETAAALNTCLAAAYTARAKVLDVPAM